MPSWRESDNDLTRPRHPNPITQTNKLAQGTHKWHVNSVTPQGRGKSKMTRPYPTRLQTGVTQAGKNTSIYLNSVNAALLYFFWLSARAIPDCEAQHHITAVRGVCKDLQRKPQCACNPADVPWSMASAKPRSTTTWYNGTPDARGQQIPN